MSFVFIGGVQIELLYESVVIIQLIELMFQKETIPISFGEKYKNIHYALRALNDTLVFLVEQQAAEQNIQYFIRCPLFLLHTDSHGKILFRKEMKSQCYFHVSVDMISPKQVVLGDNNDKKIWLIDLETHEEWSTTVDTQLFEGSIKYFKQTKLVCGVGYKENREHLIYYSLKDLKEKYAKPTIKQEHQHQLKRYHQSDICNNHSKFWLHPFYQKQTFEFQYFNLKNNPKGELRKVRFNKQINTCNYQINKIREVEPNVYLMVYKKGQINKIKEDTLHKCFIVDATKNEQSASVRQISFSFENDPKSMEMQKKCRDCYSYFIDLGQVWVFRLQYRNENARTEYVALHYVRRETLELIHTEELTYPESYLTNNYYAFHFLPFYHVQIEKETECFKDFALHFTTLIVPFTLREVSMHFLLHLNEDFDDDLLMDTVDLISE